VQFEVKVAEVKVARAEMTQVVIAQMEKLVIFPNNKPQTQIQSPNPTSSSNSKPKLTSINPTP